MLWDNGMMSAHLIVRWILWLSDGWEWDVPGWWSTNLCSILNSMKIKLQEWCSFMYRTDKTILSLVHQVHRRWCSYVLFPATFAIWTGGWPRISHIMWIYSLCIQKLATINRQKCCSNSQDSPYPSVFVSRPNVHWTGLNLTAANHVVIIQKCRGLNEQHQLFALVVWLGQNRLPHTGMMRLVPYGYSNSASHLDQHSGVVPMRVLQTMICWPNITMSRICWVLEYRKDHTQHLKVNRYT